MYRVFRIQVEVGHMSGCQLPEDAVGAFVNVYVGASTIREAMDLAERYLIEDRYRPIDISVAYELDLEEVDYETDEEGYPGNSDLEEIQLNGGRWYGPFSTFPFGDSDVDD